LAPRPTGTCGRRPCWRRAPFPRLPDALLRLMRDIGMPNGVAAVGFTEADIPDLVAGALQQQRLLATSPCPVTADDLAGIFSRSMELW
jgi:hydroxyacid-oxoacid transhydrogenase